MAVSRSELEKFLNNLLAIKTYDDYGPNGLQIEGNESLKKVAFAVSATKDSIQKAIESGADTLIVHHGLFWKFHGTRALVGPFAKRVLPLVRANINLFGYHLPLDGHIEIGNAATIAKKIGLTNLQPFGDYKGAPTGVKGEFSEAQDASTLRAQLENILSHNVLHSNVENKAIKTMGIITGGANSEWFLAMKEGLDSYLTGEMSEHDWHESKEAEVHMFAGGHNATESFGIQALMAKVEKEFGLECIFIPSPNPA